LTHSFIRLAFVVACSFAAIAIAQEPFVLEGTVPAEVPDGAVVAAQIVADSGMERGDPVATAEVVDGRFELALPATIDASLLETDRLGCGEDAFIELAYLPYLTVLEAGEPTGRLFATDIPAEFWSMGMPPRHAYAVYTPAPYTEQSECRGGVLSLQFEPGWNHVLMVRTDGGVELTSESPPEGFGWHWAPPAPSTPGN
jgi:hypothetical protein